MMELKFNYAWNLLIFYQTDDGIKIAGIEHLSLKYFDLDEATDHFSKKNIIGRGGFGYVYKVNKYNIFPKILYKFWQWI